MPRVLRSDSLRIRTLPWEMLAQIYAYCDTPTLAALSLVSYGSWELAGPILYETVELTSLDGMKALLFLEDVPSTARTDPAVPLLAQLKTLIIDIDDWTQYSEPVIHEPTWTARGGYDYASVAVLSPHRLWRAGYSTALPLDRLVLPMASARAEVFGLICLQLLPHLNPRTVVHRDVHRSAATHTFWGIRTAAFDVSFLRVWQGLERVVWAGTFLSAELQEAGYPAVNFYQRWSPPPPIVRSPTTSATLEMAFDFASQFPSYKAAWPTREAFAGDWTLVDVLRSGGADRAMADRVHLKVKLIVKQADEADVQSDVKAMQGWLKKLVVVEAV